MHICLVHRDIHRITRGGICTVYRALARRLAAAGHHVTVLTQTTPHPLREWGVEVVELPRTDDLAAHRRAVTDALIGIAPDVVDCSSWEAETLAYLDLPRAERAAVVVRGDLSARTMGVADLAAAEHTLVRGADRVIAVSDFASRDLAAAYDIGHPLVVCNGVDVDLFHPGPLSRPCSGFKVTVDHAGVTERVALTDLARRGKLMPPWDPDPAGRTQLVWIGKITPMKGWDRLQALTERLRDIARVTVLLGHSRAYCPVTIDGRDNTVILQDLDEADLPGFYRAADWLLCTSRWEGFGLAIAEALACGTPVLLPEDLGTAPELLAEGGGESYRDADHLAEILVRQTKPVGRLPAVFDWDTNAHETLAIYNGLLATTVG
ncbi:MAG: glycosyltransferase family 4 protein [Stackebrandtia sp.]